jgi:acyl carrier protein
MKEDFPVVKRTVCEICMGDASSDPAAKEKACCHECAQLFRWFREYFAHDPSFGVTWWIMPATSFTDLGVESLDWMCWLLEVEEKLGIDIPEKDTEKLHTVGEFVRYLRARGASWPTDYEIRLIQKGSCIPLRGYVWEKVHRHKKRPEPGSSGLHATNPESGVYDRELDG